MLEHEIHHRCTNTGCPEISFTIRGLDVIHTSDLPDKNLTTDNQIREISLREERIVVTKDYDFVDTHHVAGIPEYLLLITTGNISNKALFQLIETNLPAILHALTTARFIEINNHHLIVHG